MEEKLLIHNDNRAAETQIIGMKQLCQAATELKNAFEGLSFGPLSKELFISLVTDGTKCLIPLVKQNYSQRLDALQLSAIFSPFVNGMDFKAIFEPIEKPVKRVTDLVRSANLNVHSLRFEANTPIFSEVDEKSIFEAHKMWAETPDQKKLYKLVENYCAASNQLEMFLKKTGELSLNEGLVTVNQPVYCEIEETAEGTRILPNPLMFKELERIRSIRARNNKR